MLFLPGIDRSSIACKNSNIVIVMYFEAIPTITTSRSLSKLARGIQNDQVYFLPTKHVDPSSCFAKYQ